MKISSSRKVPCLGLYDDDARPLLSSDLSFSRVVPTSHYTQRAFIAYKKACNRNRSLNLFADVADSFDTAVPSSRSSARKASKGYVTSRYPESGLSCGLELKISMLNAYHQLEELAGIQPKKLAKTRAASAQVRRSAKQEPDISLLKLKLTREDICENCKRTTCNCDNTAPNLCLAPMDGMPLRSISKGSRHQTVMHDSQDPIGVRVTDLEGILRLSMRTRHSTPQSLGINLRVSPYSRRSRPSTSKGLVKQVPSKHYPIRPEQSKLLSLLRSATEKGRARNPVMLS